MMTKFLIIGVLSLCSVASPDPPVHPRWMPTGLGRSGVVHVPIWIAHPIDDSFARRAKIVLSLSEAQSVFLDTILRSIAEQDGEIREQRLADLRDRSASLGERSAIIVEDIASAEQYAAFVTACEGFNTELARIERGIFSALLPALSSTQAESLSRMENYRERQRCAVVPAAWFTTRVDLADLILEIEQTAPLQRSSDAEFDALLATYETAMTHVVRARAERKMESMRRVPVLVASNAGETDSGNRSERFSQIDRLARAVDAPERRIRDLNNTYADVLADLLVESDVTRFRSEYLARAYPEAWPNPFDVSRLIAKCSEELPPSEWKGAHAVALDAEQSMMSISEDMRQRVDRWLDQQAKNGEFDSVKFEAYKRDLDDLQAQRRAVAERGLTALRGLWNGSVPRMVDRRISEFWQIREKRRGRPLGVSYLP